MRDREDGPSKSKMKGQQTQEKLLKGLYDAAERGEAMAAEERKKQAASRKKAPKKAPKKDLSHILEESTVDTVDFAKKLKSMMPGTAKKKSKACDLRGYSKLKKADLISSIASVTSHSEADLKSLTVRKLRAIAHEHCGYKKRGS